MLILCSDGLTSSAVKSEIMLRLGNARSALIVVTADNEYKANNYHVPRCKNELNELGLSANIFDIDTDYIDEMPQYDMVEFIGGNPFYTIFQSNSRLCLLFDCAVPLHGAGGFAA